VPEQCHAPLFDAVRVRRRLSQPLHDLKSSMRAGVKLDSESIGDGRVATRGDTVTISYDLMLNRGDVVQSFNTYAFTLGSRDVIAALDYGVEGMAVGGRRRFYAGPHLGYRAVGVDGVIPPNAVLHFDVQLLGITRDSD
jgi:FKBP-type peptidyl-prolyl cis-trans isomerase